VVKRFDDNKFLLAPPQFLPELLFPFSILWLQPTDQTGRISDRTSYAPCLSLVVYSLIATLYYPPGSPYSSCLCGSPSPTQHCLSESRAATLLGLWSLNPAVHVTITRHLPDTYVLSPLDCVLPSCRTFADFGPAGLTHYTNTPILTPFRSTLCCK
jgi:hypothetical protein